MSLPTIIEAALAALMAVTPAPSLDKQEVMCLAKNIYYEARGEGLDGMIAVALVTKNRVRSKRYPNTYCKVVYQRAQFSWTLERNLRVTDKEAFKESARVAASVIAGRLSYDKFKAKYYFNPDKANPSWHRKMEYQGRIGNHTFYDQVASR